MVREAEFDMTLNLPCSVGVLAYDIDCLVRVSYDASGQIWGDDLTIDDWSLESVRLYGPRYESLLPPITAGDPVWFLLNAAAKDAEETIISECLSHAEDAMRPDPDYLRELQSDSRYEEARDRRLEVKHAAAKLLGVS